MKKLIVCLFLLYLFYGNFTYVDLNKYGSTTKKVEVKGEVIKPGIYVVERHANVKEIIDVAGGVNEKADLSAINLTQNSLNNSVIVVPEKAKQKLVSINTATLEELDTLPGVGPSVAQRIMDYRLMKPFQTLDDLRDVKGIGEKIFDKLKDYITL